MLVCEDSSSPLLLCSLTLSLAGSYYHLSRCFFLSASGVGWYPSHCFSWVLSMEGEPGGGGSGGVAGTSTEAEEPRDARMVRELLRSMGVGDGDYEPRVLHQFLELCYRYVVDVLTDAQVYSDHAGKPAIDPDDVRLAIQSKVNFSFSQPPPREVLLELARSRNKIPLPKSIAPPGSIPLPPEQDTLINPNYQLLIPRKQPSQVEETEDEEEAPDPNPNPNSALPQEQRTDNEQQQQQQQQAPQRVSFPLAAAAAAAGGGGTGTKRPR